MAQAEKTESSTAEHASEATAKFLSLLSHDLRGGLNGAVLMLEVIKRTLLADPNSRATIDDLDIVRQSIMETVATMDRFVLAEKLRLGRVPLKLELVDLGSLLRQAAGEIAALAKDRGCDLSIDCPDGLNLQTDRQLLQRLVFSLLANAVKFGRGKPVAIRGLAGESSASSCRIEIIDHGAGMAADKLNAVFGALDVSEIYGARGTGMGLYLARRIAKLLNIEIHAESEPAKGSRIVLDVIQPRVG